MLTILLFISNHLWDNTSINQQYLSSLQTYSWVWTQLCVRGMFSCPSSATEQTADMLFAQNKIPGAQVQSLEDRKSNRHTAPWQCTVLNPTLTPTIAVHFNQGPHWTSLMQLTQQILNIWYSSLHNIHHIKSPIVLEDLSTDYSVFSPSCSDANPVIKESLAKQLLRSKRQKPGHPDEPMRVRFTQKSTDTAAQTGDQACDKI